MGFVLGTFLTQMTSLTRIAGSADARVVVQKEPGYGRAQTSVKEAIAD